VCIPHWQVQTYMTACLRSIRKHSAAYDLQVIVVDNGSQDGSLDYLRSLSWIHLIERPEERPANWPRNVFTAWDRGLEKAVGEYFVTMHSDVFVQTDGWLDPLLREIGRGPACGASGAWKLELEHPLYLWQKRVLGFFNARIKTMFGRKTNARWRQGHYPRDYCAMYRTSLIRKHALTFCPYADYRGGGHSIAQQLLDCGYEMGMVPVREMAENIFHVAHGTAAVVSEKPLNHQRAQKKVERKVRDLFDEVWIQNLLDDESLDGGRRIAA
ncbi:MAG: glycosyltransferase family 2 protein, partial [Planctomycetaceae bacterium]